MGLHQAGFEVLGVDIRRQPRYPFAFVQADALDPPVDLTTFDLIWASPPCQAYTAAGFQERARGTVYPDLIEPVRKMLTGHPMTVIENVPLSPVRKDLILDGWMFPQLRVIRERWFELSWFMLSSPKSRPRGLLHRGYMSVAGNGTQGWCYKLGYKYRTADLRRAMGIDWMSRAELSQAIPPPYAEFIGRAARGMMP